MRYDLYAPDKQPPGHPIADLSNRGQPCRAFLIRHAPDRSGWVVQIHHVAHVLLRCFSNYADIVPRMTYRWCGSMLTSLPKLIFISVECDRTRRFIAFLALRCELGKNVSGKYLRWPDRNAIE